MSNLRIECFDCKFIVYFNIDNIKSAIEHSERHVSKHKLHNLYFIELSAFAKSTVRDAIQ